MIWKILLIMFAVIGILIVGVVTATAVRAFWIKKRYNYVPKGYPGMEEMGVYFRLLERYFCNTLYINMNFKAKDDSQIVDLSKWETDGVAALTFNIPENLSNYVSSDLFQKIKGNVIESEDFEEFLGTIVGDEDEIEEIKKIYYDNLTMQNIMNQDNLGMVIHDCDLILLEDYTGSRTWAYELANPYNNENSCNSTN